MAGKEIKLIESAEEKNNYVQQILLDLQALGKLLEEDKFEKNNARIGAELELNFLDADYYPNPIGPDIYHDLKPDGITTEYARFNLEINAEPVLFSGKSLSRLKKNLTKPLNLLQKEAKKRNSHIILSGIIPTLGRANILADALTPEPRYKVLYDLRREMHGDHYEFNISGEDELIIRDNLLLFAGCMTSFQIHLQLSPKDIISKYNWAQMISAPLLASATCSPLFLGKKLWHETRIALFQQSSDMRKRLDGQLHDEQSRVNFGSEWVQKSILELFQDDITNYEPVFVCDDDEDPIQKIQDGIAPSLKAWSYFNGSVYRWNRVCYGVINNKPALRIENRILPAGPTMEDQIANAAFWLGMMNGMPEKYENIHENMPFEAVKHNFFKAAQLGLDAQFKWLNGETLSAAEVILEELIPLAKAGLKHAHVDDKEAEHYLNIIKERVTSGKTGSHWLLESYDKLRKNCQPEEALINLTASMLKRQKTDKPVHTWEPVFIDENEGWQNRFDKVQKFMTTSFYRVAEHTIVDLAAHMMEWKKVGNILVENDAGELVGVINKNAIINFLLNENVAKNSGTTVSEIMVQNPITVSPETPIEEAIKRILENEINCLPVIKDKKAVGIVTRYNFIKIAEYLVSNNKD